MKKNRKTAVFMSALMLCSMCGAALPEGIPVFAEETGSQETMASDQQTTLKSTAKETNTIDRNDPEFIKDLCLNKKTICENGKIAISIHVTDSFRSFSTYHGSYEISCEGVENVNGDYFYTVFIDNPELVDDEITIKNNLTKEAFTYAVTENGTKISEVSHTEASRNIEDVEAIFASRESKEEFCLNSGTYIKDGLFVVGTETVRNFEIFMEMSCSGNASLICCKSDAIKIDGKEYFIGAFSIEKDAAVKLSSEEMIKQGPETQQELYYKISENGNRIEKVEEQDYEKAYRNISEYIPYTDKEIIDFCENKKVIYEDGCLVLGFVDTDETWAGISFILGMESIYSCEHDGKYYYVMRYEVPDDSKINIPADTANLKDKTPGEIIKEVVGLPECMPISSEEIYDFCENTKAECEDGMFVVGFVTDIDKYRGITMINNQDIIKGRDRSANEYKMVFELTKDGKYYSVFCFDTLKDGVFGAYSRHDDIYFTEDEDYVFYQISDNCNSIKEISYSDAHRKIENIPDAVPYDYHEVTSFYENKKMECKDGTLVLLFNDGHGFCHELEKFNYYGYSSRIEGKEIEGYTKDDKNTIGGVYIDYFENVEDGIYSYYDDAHKRKYIKVSDNGNTVTEIKYTDMFEAGDIDGNGVTDLTDLSYLSLYLLGAKELIGLPQQNAADVTGDSMIDISDLATLKQYVSKDPDVVLKKSDEFVRMF